MLAALHNKKNVTKFSSYLKRLQAIKMGIRPNYNLQELDFYIPAPQFREGSNKDKCFELDSV